MATSKKNVGLRMGVLLASAVFFGPLLATGCGNSGGHDGIVKLGQGVDTSKIDNQISQIQANTHMPDQTKQQLIGMLQAQKAHIEAEKAAK